MKIDLALDAGNRQLQEKLTDIEQRLVQKPLILRPDDPRNQVSADTSAMEELFAVMEENKVQNPRNMTEKQFYYRLTRLSKHGPRNTQQPT